MEILSTVGTQQGNEYSKVTQECDVRIGSGTGMIIGTGTGTGTKLLM